jgi:hypothetical protein
VLLSGEEQQPKCPRCKSPCCWHFVHTDDGSKKSPGGRLHRHDRRPSPSPLLSIHRLHAQSRAKWLGGDFVPIQAECVHFPEAEAGVWLLSGSGTKRCVVGVLASVSSFFLLIPAMSEWVWEWWCFFFLTPFLSSVGDVDVPRFFELPCSMLHSLVRRCHYHSTNTRAT